MQGASAKNNGAYSPMQGASAKNNGAYITNARGIHKQQSTIQPYCKGRPQTTKHRPANKQMLLKNTEEGNYYSKERQQKTEVPTIRLPGTSANRRPNSYRT